MRPWHACRPDPAHGDERATGQARLRFCAGFGSRGVYNFGELGSTLAVEDDDARRRDRARATQIGFASAAIGLAAGVAALAIPR